MKLLSITVPAYNAQETLAATLSSLCGCGVNDFIDVIVIDDGSTDATAAVAQSFVDRYPGSVRLIRKENGGHGSAVNAGIDAAVGRFFKVIDADDRVEPAGFTALIGRLEVTRADLVAAHYKKVRVSDGDEVPMRFENVEFGRLYRFRELPVDGKLYFGIHSINYKTDLLRKAGVRLQEHTFYVDAEFGLLPIPFVETVEFLDEYVYLYYVGNTGQSISHANFVRRYEDHYRVVRRMTEYAASYGTQPEQLAYMRGVLAKLCFTNYMLAVFYDEDIKRGKARAREFDVWLNKNDPALYAEVGKSLYIRGLRRIGFCFLPRGAFFKSAVSGIYAFFKPFVRKRRKLTY